ncbi:MAG: hypothetical protein ACI8WB_000491 [Phenylobacterium sp.]|jgi:hypothetical protein
MTDNRKNNQGNFMQYIMKHDKKKMAGLLAICLSALLCWPVFADDLDIIITGDYAPNVVNPYDKSMTKDGIVYGLKRNDDANGTFISFTMITKADDPSVTTWSEPTVVLGAADLANKGTDSADDYTLSQIRAVKWFSCPGTSNMSIWAKRHGADANGNRITKKELLRATILGANKTPADSYTDSVIINQPFGYSSGDLGTIVDNNTQYIISAATDEGKINLYEVNNDCTDLAGTTETASLEWHNEDNSVDHREAPAIFKQDNYFYITTSGKTSWRPNQQKYAYSQFLSGPWSAMLEFGDSTAYHSQLFSTNKVTATDGSANYARLFSSTRNAATWNGADSRRVWLPLYFNTATDLATNYYDYVEINNLEGKVKGFHYDHGTKLTVSSVTIDGSSTNADNLIDGDLSTYWYNNNDAAMTSATFDLGTQQIVKALKLKHYDLYKSNGTVADVTLRTPFLKIEIGDGTNFTQVFADVVGSITWLQPIDVPDTLGRYVRLSLIENHKGNSLGVTNDFGFYETQIWGNNANASALVFSDFAGDIPNTEPTGWTLEQGANTSALVVADNINQVLQLSDSNNSARIVVSKQFTAQQGSEVVTRAKVKFGELGKGEYIRLFSNGNMLINIVNSTTHNSLAFSDAGFNDTKVADINPDIWYSIKISANTDAQTFDFYLDEQLVWGGAHFANSGNVIDQIKIGTSTNKTNSIAYFDDIDLSGPIFAVTTPEPPNSVVLFSDDFENGFSHWISVSGSWATTADSNQVLSNTSSSNDVATAGEVSWSNYSVSADVKRDGRGAAIVGRYATSNSYYQLMIYDTDTYKLSKNVNGNWTLLASGGLVNSSQNYYKLALDFNGSTITASVDSQVITSVIDSSINGGAIGFRVITGTASYDNVQVIEN